MFGLWSHSWFYDIPDSRFRVLGKPFGQRVANIINLLVGIPLMHWSTHACTLKEIYGKVPPISVSLKIECSLRSSVSVLRKGFLAFSSEALEALATCCGQPILEEIHGHCT